MNRREFLGFTAIATAGTVFAQSANGGKTAAATNKKVEIDPNLAAFLSDIHVSCGKNGMHTHQNALFEKAVNKVLALNPRPKNVLIFGDIANDSGLSEDYETSIPVIQRLKDAGIDVYLTTGNHDHRKPLFRYHPRQAEITPVPGRFVSIVNLGFADFVLLDSLNETGNGEGKNNAVPGTIDKAQLDWLEEFAKKSKRPFFCGAHHPPKELTCGKRSLMGTLLGNDNFIGFIHGHNHKWKKDWARNWSKKGPLARVATLPSTGWWGDIGFATFRTYEDRAVLENIQYDFFIPRPLAPGMKAPAAWGVIINENNADKCTFSYSCSL